MDCVDYVNTQDKTVGKSVGSEIDIKREDSVGRSQVVCGTNKQETEELRVQGNSMGMRLMGKEGKGKGQAHI